MKAGTVLAIVLGGILTLALLTVLMENIQVVPTAEDGADKRLHHQMKNVTRLPGDEEAVLAAIERAVSFNGRSAIGPTTDWQSAVQAATGWRRGARHVVGLPGEGGDAKLWSLPGAWWAAFAGSPTVFLPRDQLDPAARARIIDLELPVYILAPPELIGEAVVDAIADVTPVERIAGATLAEHAVRIASFRDLDTDFGWGREHADLATWMHLAMAATSDSAQAYAALPLARTVGAAFLFADDGGGIPGATDHYWWSLRADWFTTPSETSFRHLWILGDRVSYAAQARMDLAVEKAAYLSKGSVALGPLEALGLVFLSFGASGFVFVLLHANRLLPELSGPMRAAWAFTALLVPMLGVILYLGAHRRPRLAMAHDMPAWLRPPALQSATATAMGFGFGAPLMIAIGWFFAYYGFPLLFGEWAADGWQFLFGAGMPWMMAGMYLGAVAVAWPLVQLHMQAMVQGATTKAVLWRALGVTALSMAAVSLGMMTMTWFMMMEREPMMMPHEDELMWFVSIWLGSAIGFLIAWPLNWPMVRTRLKSGAM